MKQKQVNLNQDATLYLIATPIGNLKDMTPRAIETIQMVDILLVEDTRVSSKLLHHYQIEKSMTSYHEHNKDKLHETIAKWFHEKKTIGLLSDAGMPLISDPGLELVGLARELGVNVIAIPGANAALTALVTSGIKSHPFLFYGFLPSKKNERMRTLERLQTYPETLIFYEAPHRIKDTLQELYTSLGDRHAYVARELTKLYEEGTWGKLSELAKVESWIGELVLVVEGYLEEIKPVVMKSIKEAVNDLLASGFTKQEAFKQVAKEYNLTKSVVYREYHQEEVVQ